MKLIHKYILATLGIVGLSIGSVWIYTGGPESYRIRSEFERDMLVQLRRTHQTMSGADPVSVEVTRMTHGPKGYSIEYQINYDTSVTQTGVQLNDDGFGRYCCHLNTRDGKAIDLDIAG